MMTHKVLAAGVLAIALSACSKMPEWMMLGSINGLDRAKWSAATNEQQLGTAAYWLMSLERKGWLNDPSLVEGEKFKAASMTLQNRINDHLAFSNKETDVLVAECVQLNAWANTDK